MLREKSLGILLLQKVRFCTKKYSNYRNYVKIKRNKLEKANMLADDRRNSTASFPLAKT